jgi:FO synthase
VRSPDAARSAAVVTDSSLRRALRRATDGVTLDATEAEVLLAARGPHLAALAEAAGRVRDAGLARRGRPGTVTYSRKVFVPLTRLCRDRCHYCTFATVPHRLPAAYLSPDEVLAIARQGQAQGCKEALFTLGDRPEDRWPAAREWLDAHGYDDTLAYVRAMAVRVLEETGLLPHLNPGVLSWADLQRLKPVAPSMGMMLETTARRLFAEPSGPHYGSPDKDPEVRLRTLVDAGRSAVPFTSGLLLGIGETPAERIDTLLALRATAREYGALQEVIVQNFRAKEDTAMRGEPDVEAEELAATVAVARLLLGPDAHVQAPPNLVDLRETALLLAAGIDDWGGVSPVTPDHVNPERPWPAVDRLAEASAAAGFTLTERLTVYPEYVLAGEPWLDPRVLPHVRALADPATGLADPAARPVGRPWQEPDGGAANGSWGSSGRIDLHAAIDTDGRFTERRGDAATVYGDTEAAAARVSHEARTRGSAGPVAVPTQRLRPAFTAALAAAERSPAGITDAQALTLFDAAPGAELDALCALADDIRRATVGDVVSYVNTRNINFTNVCYTGCRFCAFAQRRTDADAYTLSLDEVGRRAEQAWEVGATEVCMQGGIHPDLPGTAYADLVAEVRRRAPGLHVHAFSPMEVMNGVARTGLSITEFLASVREAGLGSLPGTAAEILDDDVRWVLTKGKLPAAAWVEVVTTAHRMGIPTTSTMMYGHVDTPAHWVAHLRLLARIQGETGGFTEFVPLPFVHHSSPVYLAGLARPGPTVQENRAVHAMARLLLHGAIDHVQVSWVKLGPDGCRQILAGGADDLGGTLMEETISRMAGSQWGSRKSVADLAAIAAAAGRPHRQRTTLYGDVSDERRTASRRPLPAVPVGGPVALPSPTATRSAV